jgi:hypothetical protein
VRQVLQNGWAIVVADAQAIAIDSERERLVATMTGTLMALPGERKNEE